MTHLHKAITILYVDDEELARKYFTLAAQVDYEVITAPDTITALAILKQSHEEIDIVVTDFRMPTHTGGELLQQLETDYPHLVRILLTAYADKEVLINTINRGDLFRVLEKPLNISELRTHLRLAAAVAIDRRAKREQLKTMTETLGFLSHELNTPLAALMNFSRGIQRRSTGDQITPAEISEIHQAATTMESNAVYGLSVIAMFVSSLRSAQQPLVDQSKRTASDLVLSMLDTLPLGHLTRQEVQVDIDEDFDVLNGIKLVPLVLSSVINNASRALKDTPAPKISISISRFKITVADNGPGIPESIKERLLKDPVTTHLDSGGTGMGLIFCQRIMLSIGGSISIESQHDLGTTVVLGFPERKKYTHA